MRAVLSWLQEFAPIGDDVDALTDAFNMLGMAVEDVIVTGEPIKGIVVAQVLQLRPHPRADRIQLVDVDDNEKPITQLGQTGRVMITTLTKEFFVPRFLERDEAELEPPCAEFPWDGVSGVRPYRVFAATTTVGVY